VSIEKLQNILLKDIGERLSIFGFDNIPKQQTFYRPFEEGWNCVHLSFINHAYEFDITVDVAIRFNQIEEMVNSENTNLTKKEKKETTTLGVELGNLSVGEQKRWTISSDEKLSLVSDSIVEKYKRFGDPYLLKYSSMVSAYELLASDDKSVWKHCPFHATRAKKAIAIAKHIGLSDMNTRIMARKRFLQEINDFGLADFIRFTSNMS